MEWSLQTVWNDAFPPSASPAYDLSLVLRLIMAAVLGGAIGIQRQRQQKSAGLRTHMLVALGSALFVIAPLEAQSATGADISRVVQGIATGIGFLGGGAILKFSGEHRVKGLTSAAAIWVTAGLGVAVALGMFWTSVTVVVVTWLVLAALGKAETLSFFRKPTKQNRVP